MPERRFPPALEAPRDIDVSLHRTRMTNVLEQAINCDDGDRAAKLIRDALGIESDDV
jgi:hypothetical protein